LIKIDASNEGKDSTWLDTSSGWRDDTNEPVIELATSRNQGQHVAAHGWRRGTYTTTYQYATPGPPPQP